MITRTVECDALLQHELGDPVMDARHELVRSAEPPGADLKRTLVVGQSTHRVARLRLQQRELAQCAAGAPIIRSPRRRKHSGDLGEAVHRLARAARAQQRVGARHQHGHMRITPLPTCILEQRDRPLAQLVASRRVACALLDRTDHLHRVGDRLDRSGIGRFAQRKALDERLARTSDILQEPARPAEVVQRLRKLEVGTDACGLIGSCRHHLPMGRDRRIKVAPCGLEILVRQVDDRHRVANARQRCGVFGQVGLRIPLDALEQRRDRDRRIVRGSKCIRCPQAREEGVEGALGPITADDRRRLGAASLLPEHAQCDSRSNSAGGSHTEPEGRPRMLAHHAAHAIAQALLHRRDRIPLQPCAQVGGERSGAGVAELGIPSQAHGADGFEIAADRGRMGAVGRCTTRGLHRPEHRLLGAEGFPLRTRKGQCCSRDTLRIERTFAAGQPWQHAGQLLEEHHAESPNVGTRVDVAGRRELLRAHEGRRAVGLVGGRDVMIDECRDAEVDDLGTHATVTHLEQHVGGLEVAVHDALGVRMLHRIAHARQQRDALVERQPQVVGGVVEWPALHELHRHERQTTRQHTCIEHGGDARVAHRRKRLGLVLESRIESRRSHGRIRDLQRHAPPHRCELLGLEHSTETADTAQRHDAVTTTFRAHQGMRPGKCVVRRSRAERGHAAGRGIVMHGRHGRSARSAVRCPTPRGAARDRCHPRCRHR